MDTFYVSHGSPMLPLHKELAAHEFFSQWHKLLPYRPTTAILVISAHWDTTIPAVNTVTHNNTIHDFYGFPSALYKLQYNAPGAPNLARKVKSLLKDAGFESVYEDSKRGLDHGAWIPLLLMYPKADLPVCQLSIQLHKDAAHHYKMGQALTSLREEGVLIVGSGSATHNLRELNFDDAPTPSWALEFDNWLHESLSNGRIEDVIQFEKKAPYSKRAHPSPDHFYPLLVALGAAGTSAKGKRIHSSWVASTGSMASFAFKSGD